MFDDVGFDGTRRGAEGRPHADPVHQQSSVRFPLTLSLLWPVREHHASQSTKKKKKTCPTSCYRVLFAFYGLSINLGILYQAWSTVHPRTTSSHNISTPPRLPPSINAFFSCNNKLLRLLPSRNPPNITSGKSPPHKTWSLYHLNIYICTIVTDILFAIASCQFNWVSLSTDKIHSFYFSLTQLPYLPPPFFALFQFFFHTTLFRVWTHWKLFFQACFKNHFWFPFEESRKWCQFPCTCNLMGWISRGTLDGGQMILKLERLGGRIVVSSPFPNLQQPR